MISRNKALAYMLGLRDQSLEMINSVDTRVQNHAHDAYMNAANYMGDSLGGVPRSGLQFIGDAVHQPASAYPNTINGRAGLIGARALQAGGVTAAGAGLANLTQQMAETFGGTGDIAGSDTLYM